MCVFFFFDTKCTPSTNWLAFCPAYLQIYCYALCFSCISFYRPGRLATHRNRRFSAHLTKPDAPFIPLLQTKLTLVYRDGRCREEGKLSAAVMKPLKRIHRDGVWLRSELTALCFTPRLILGEAQSPLAASGVFTGQLLSSALVALIGRVTSTSRGAYHVYETYRWSGGASEVLRVAGWRAVIARAVRFCSICPAVLQANTLQNGPALDTRSSRQEARGRVRWRGAGDIRTLISSSSFDAILIRILKKKTKGK